MPSAVLERTVVSAGGREVTLFRAGPPDGVPLLALHGGFTDPQSDWGPLVPFLEGRYSLLLPLLRGHDGAAVGAGEAIGPASIARDTIELVAALGLERPVVAGFSLGARAVLVAAASGLDAAALVLLGPRFVAFGRDEYAALEQLACRFWPEWGEPARAEARRALADGIVDFGIDPVAWAEQSGEVPVLVLRGDRDRVSPGPELELLAERRPSVRLVTLAGHGHRLQDTATAETAAAIDEFLEQALAR